MIVSFFLMFLIFVRSNTFDYTKKIIFVLCFFTQYFFYSYMKNKIWLYILLSTLLFTSSCGVKKTINKADKKYALGNYNSAAAVYKRAYRSVSPKDKPLRAKVAYQLANCYRLTNNNQRAEFAYANAIRNNCKDSLVYLYYAEVLRKNGKYSDALANYKLFEKKDSTNSWAKNGIVSCIQVQQWLKNPSRYEIKKEDKLNSRKYAEFCPAFSGEDGDVLYFNSSRENPNVGGKSSQITGLRNNDIFVVKKNISQEWESPLPVEGELNTAYDEGTVSFSSDGKTMYFTRCRNNPMEGGSAEIFMSTRAGAKWGAAQKVEVLKDSSIMVAHPAISPDGNFLYFVSDMKGGFGGKDIWRVKKMDGNKWGALQNLGSDINTPGDEMFPYVKSNGELYFSSNGLPGFGGLDIFKAINEDETKWKVENLNIPINSSADDFGITFAGNSETGFFSSSRNEIKGYDKLWSFYLPKIEYVLTGKVSDVSSEPISDVVLRIIGDDGTNTKIRPQKDGLFKYQLKEDVNYIMLASSRGYLNRKQEVTTVGLKNGKKFVVNFELPSVSKPVQVNNIFYELGKWTFTADSEAGLQDLARLLQDNPNITMEIASHTDMIGSKEDNISLSKKRAQSVVDYLIKAGIDKERLSPVGYGEDKPVVVDKQLSQKYPFLKEKEELNEEFVLSLTPEQQEVANQINRRTEFKVLKTTYKLY